MKLQQIEFTGLRNLAPCQIFPHDKVNVIYGQNAQGKTNFLEGIWLFTGGKSFRGTRDSNLIGFSQPFARLRIAYQKEYQDSILEETAEIRLQEKREIFINEVMQKSSLALTERFHAVIFSPLHLKLVENGPEIRRKFLDAAISQLYPRYVTLLHQYTRAVAQRNAALKNLRFHPDLEELITVFEDSIAALGARIIRYRCRYVELLAEFAPAIYSGISGGKEQLHLEYASRISLDPAESNLVAALRQTLTDNRQEDEATCSTSVGPHRDDLDLSINDLAVRSYGSQGQKRSAVLSLKLAEAQVLDSVTGEQPVVLLDDVMSELDTARQKYILNHISHWQVFITCCDPAPIPSLSRGKVFYMEDGVITPK